MVDPQPGIVRVPRIVAIFDVGKLRNTQTGRSQFIGGIVWGVSLALHEDTYIDERTGRVANANLADCCVPVNADIGEIDVSATDIPARNSSLSARAALEKPESPALARLSRTRCFTLPARESNFLLR